MHSCINDEAASDCFADHFGREFNELGDTVGHEESP